MEISTDFALPLPPDSAYQLLLDLERVAPCMPGASLGGERKDGSREVSVAVRLGPMKFNYGGTVRISERDDAARRAVLVGTAQEKRGQGSARATITMTVAEGQDGHSQVQSQAEFDLTGRAAQTGRGIVEDVARRMVSDMASCLAVQASTDTGDEPASAAEPAGAEADAAATDAPGTTGNQPSAGQAGVPPATPAAAPPAAPASAPPTAPAPAPTAPPAVAAREIRAGSMIWSILKERLGRLWRRLLGRPSR